MLQKRSPWCFKSVYPMKAKKNKIKIKKRTNKERKKKGQNQGRKKDKLPFLRLESL